MRISADTKDLLAVANETQISSFVVTDCDIILSMTKLNYLMEGNGFRKGERQTGIWLLRLIFLNGIKLEFTCYNIDAEVEIIYIRLTLQPID